MILVKIQVVLFSILIASSVLLFVLLLIDSFKNWRNRKKKTISIQEALDIKETVDCEIFKINSVFDGDSFRATLKGVHDFFGKNIPIKINNITVPNIYSSNKKEKEQAEQTKKFVLEQLRNAKKIELKNMQRDKYFRIRADVFCDNINLASLLLEKKMAQSIKN